MLLSFLLGLLFNSVCYVSKQLSLNFSPIECILVSGPCIILFILVEVFVYERQIARR